MRRVQTGTLWTTSGPRTCSVWPTRTGLHRVLEKGTIHLQSQKVNNEAGGGGARALESKIPEMHQPSRSRVPHRPPQSSPLPLSPVTCLASGAFEFEDLGESPGHQREQLGCQSMGRCPEVRSQRVLNTKLKNTCFMLAITDPSSPAAG